MDVAPEAHPPRPHRENHTHRQSDTSTKDTSIITRDFEVWTGAPDDASEPDATMRVTFASPTPSPEHEDCWCCELRIDAFGITRVHVIAGIDGLQAFRLAMQWAEAELDFLAQQRGVMITFLGGGDLFGLAAAAR